MPVKLYEHQKQGIVTALTHMKAGGRGFYYAHDPGLGKTLSAIMTARLLGAKKIVVLCPKVALFVWRRQVMQWYPQAIVFVNAPGWRTDKPTFHVVNYDQYRGSKEKIWSIRLANADLLILDESHYVKTPTAKVTRAVLRLATLAKKVLLLSGTPAHAPTDWWSQYRLIAPDDPYWAQPFKTYRAQVSKLGGPQNNWVVGEKGDGVAEAKKHMTPYTHVASMEQLDLPEPVHEPILYDLSPRELKAYRQLERDLVADLDENGQVSVDIVLVKLLRLHQLTGGYVPNDHDNKIVQLGTSKLDTCMELLDQWCEHRVVIACRFRHEIEQLKQTIKGRQVWTITGDTSSVERSRIEETFQKTKDPAVIVLQYRAGGVALTLTGARALILYSMEPSVIGYRQMLGRVWRISMTHAPVVYPLLANQTLDSTIYESLQAKADTVALVKKLKEKLGR